MSVAVHRSAPRSRSLDVRSVRRAAERMLDDLGLAESELSVLLTDDRVIQELNAKHRRKNKPTDVLAFPMEEPGKFRGGKPNVGLLGDVVISIDTAVRQAQKGKRSLLAEVTHLLAHGLLHLVGYDHQTDEEERAMNEMTDRLVRAAASQRRVRRNLVRTLRSDR